MFSFTRRKQLQQVADFMGRLANLTTPNLLPMDGTERAARRYNRTLTVLLVPLHANRVAADRAFFAVTSDLSDQGLAVTTAQPVEHRDMLICLWSPTARDDSATGAVVFLQGEVRQQKELGGGFWQVGLQLSRLLHADNADDYGLRRLSPMLSQLAPPSAASACLTP